MRAATHRTLPLLFVYFPKFTHPEEDNMSLVQFIISMVVVGVIMWLINVYVPMQSAVKKIMNIVVVVVICLYILSLFGIIGPFSGLRIRGL
jgi:hypothetical protein